ncbi:peptide transporter [candidate division TA06 bacterium SM23_40]|uniref:Peptide transporter n=1 Tax=candidate division TA06 bacterium SM23_40 TaxID=1703774 RepID=A0A0S8G874_UNCT6|nr:MAG: peptide transporter [candidate division TA06 bacterium SM23_40]
MRPGARQTDVQTAEEEPFQPYVTDEFVASEITVKSIVLGSLVGIVFGAANAYLGLRVGMTVSASIPAAVISMGILRGLLKRGTVLENNMVQTIGSAGESLAAGVIFTIPALIIWGLEIPILEIFVMSLLGGVLGVLFMIPLRRYLIVREHGRLPYPEGTACAEVLIAGDEGGTKARTVFTGVGIGALYNYYLMGFRYWEHSPHWNVRPVRGAQIGIDLTPELLGVGYIIGPRIASYVCAGGVLAWLVLIPILTVFGDRLGAFLPAAAQPISELEPSDIWNSYIRYMGAGAVALGGIVSLIRAGPTIVSSLGAGFREVMQGLGPKRIGPGGPPPERPRTERDLPMSLVLGGVLAVALLAWLMPFIHVGLLGALLVAVFAFFFVTVSSRIVGLIGSSSNPVSGMTIATLLATALIFHALGWTGTEGKVAALSVGALVCIALCIAGDVSQDLKTGYLVGATPRRQQMGELVGVLTSALFVGWTIFLLNSAYGIPSEQLSAPQATLMSLVVEGVMTRTLPWALVFVGAAIAAVVELMRIPSLPFAVGLYLPISLSTPVMAGGLVRWGVGRVRDAGVKKRRTDRGVLFASGLIAGGAVMGIILAFFAWRRVDLSRLVPLEADGAWMGPLTGLVSLLMFGILAALLVLYSVRGGPEGSSERREAT